MFREIFCIADTQSQAEGLVGKIKQMGIAPDDVFIATQRSEIAQLAYPNSQLFRDSRVGAVVGALVGAGYGIATLAVMGLAAIPGWFEGLVLVGAGSLGGSLLGTVIGATGAWGTARMSPAIEHHYEDEIGRGRIVVSVQFRDFDDLEKVVDAIGDWGMSDVHYSREIAA